MIGKIFVAEAIMRAGDVRIAEIEVEGERLFVPQRHGRIDTRGTPERPYRILGSYHSLPKFELPRLGKSADRRSREKALQCD